MDHLPASAELHHLQQPGDAADEAHLHRLTLLDAAGELVEELPARCRGVVHPEAEHAHRLTALAVQPGDHRPTKLFGHIDTALRPALGSFLTQRRADFLRRRRPTQNNERR